MTYARVVDISLSFSLFLSLRERTTRHARITGRAIGLIKKESNIAVTAAAAVRARRWKKTRRPYVGDNGIYIYTHAHSAVLLLISV